MKLLRVGPAGAERPVLQDRDGKHFDLAPIVADIDPAFWAQGPALVSQAHAEGRLAEIDIAGQRIGAPVSRLS